MLGSHKLTTCLVLLPCFPVALQVGYEVAAAMSLDGCEAECPAIARPVLSYQGADTASFCYRDAGVDLRTLHGRWSQGKRKRFTRKLATGLYAALAYLHSKVRPSNRS